ncbi:hypothetical protein DL95DRAFT_451819 [Leptodontidium sp. 2 PMI_412]|nr:hypothetical protein DL95DRAFT_451819 [Leptodontidium sp. 2 PMI_412]
MNTYDSFPEFSTFPSEVRRLIWRCCLPRRIAEVDFPFTLLDGKDSRQACWPNRTTYQNARVPLVAAVCREAREVVFECGSYKETQDDTSLRSIWIQPKIDRALHLNWTRRRNLAFFIKWDAWIPPFEDTPVTMHICTARWEYEMRVSFVGEVLFLFDLRELMGSPPLVVSSPSFFDSHMQSEIPRMPVGDMSRDGTAVDTRAVMELLDEHPVYMTLVAISLHLDRTVALESGLFGLLADAPVQTIDFDDVPQLRKFYELFNSDPGLKIAEPHVEKLFNVLLSPAFHAAVLLWKAKVRWLLRAAAWRYMQIGDTLKSFGGEDPRSVWQPPVPNDLRQQYLQIDQFVPNEDHPWWAEHGDKLLPKVVPQIMLRLCDNQCYREERRPDMFGELWFIDSEWRTGWPNELNQERETWMDYLSK